MHNPVIIKDKNHCNSARNKILYLYTEIVIILKSLTIYRLGYMKYMNDIINF